MYNFIDVFNTVQRFRRGFLYTYTETDEPTFLTFSLDFDFDNELTNEFTGLYDSPLLIDNDQINYSAIYYLNSIDRKPEAERLREFKKVLKYTTMTQPWFFQSIKGLDKLWKATTNFDETFRGKDIVLEIETLESLDLRITYLADLYRKGVFDTLYRRELVPENLRKFKMDIYVAEFRNLRSLTDHYMFNNDIAYNNKRYATLAENALNLIRSATDYFFKNSTFYKFELYFSEFDFSETFPFPSGNVHSPKMATNKFKIKADWFVENPTYKNYQIKTTEYFTKYINDDIDMWSQNKPVTMDGILSSVGTLYNVSKEVASFSNDLRNPL